MLFLDNLLNQLLGHWSWICSLKGPDKKFICCRIDENRLVMKWVSLTGESGGQIFIVNGDKITTPDDPSIEGSFKEDGLVVFYDINDMTSPVAIWSRNGENISLYNVHKEL